jgi:type II secretion system protein C
MDQKRSAVILWFAKAALLAILLYVGFGAVTHRLPLVKIFDPSTAGGEQQASDAPATMPQEHSPSDYAAIVERDLFTEAERADTSRVSVSHPSALDMMPSAEELGLRLVGAIAGGPSASRAIIQDTKSNATASYRMGDAVAPATGGSEARALVKTIQRKAVVLRYQGRDLVLKLHAGVVAGNSALSAGAADKENVRAGGPPEAESPVSADAQTTPFQRGGYVAEVFHKATIEPYVNQGETQGLRITGLENIPMAALFGLKNGDIVQSVDGQQLTSKQKAFQVLMKARTQSKVDLQLLRDGRSKSLSFDL